MLPSGDIEVCHGSTPREIPKLDAFMKAKGLHIFHQNVRKVLSNKDYLVELIDSFKKVQVFVLTEVLVNKDLHYGVGRNTYTKSLNLEEMI